MKINQFNLVLSFVSSLSLLFYSCKSDKDLRARAKNQKVVYESKKLNKYLDDVFDAYVDRHPEYQSYLGIKKDYDKWDDISPSADEIEFNIAKESVQWLRDSINIDFLNEKALLSYQLYKKKLENQLFDYRYRLYNYPLNQMSGKQSSVPAFLINMHKISSKKDAKDYIARLIGIGPLFNQLNKNIRERESFGIVPPNFILDHVLDDSKNVISGFPLEGRDSCALFLDFHNKLSKLQISEVDRDSLLFSCKQAIRINLKSSYEELIDLVINLKNKYDEQDGVWRWKGGIGFYENALKRTTTTNMSAEEIHLLGLEEVKRIHEEMKTIKTSVGFNGTLDDFFLELKQNDDYYFSEDDKGRQEYIKEAEEIIENFKLKLDDIFQIRPKADMIVKSVEKFREKSAGKAFYQRPAPDGSRPGTYYANTYKMRMMPKYQMEALAYHEGIPGHHMQISIAQELDGIPKFRKYGSYTAYTEGWGLYSEYFPKEFGFYSDPFSDFGRLAMELWRSCRLVVDTGIHYKQWSREKSIHYYLNNTPNDELDCIKMVERHIVYPSQATAYKIGMNKMLQLRERAKQKLGDDFDIRIFHDTILSRGAVPLYVLENFVNKMIENRLKEKL